MATQTKSVSGTVTTYTITDQASNVMTITVTATPGHMITTSASGGPLLQDGTQTLATLVQLLATGLVP